MKAGSRKGQAAFTLIEMLIVIVILGILAMVIIPQISTSTDDAKLSTLRTNLSVMRNAVELYYAQHSAYPGAGTATFADQLTQYTKADGTVSATRTADAKFGPYIKGTIPKNPFTEKNDVSVDKTVTDITTRTPIGTTAWTFYALTGVLIANDHPTE